MEPEKANTKTTLIGAGTLVAIVAIVGYVVIQVFG